MTRMKTHTPISAMAVSNTLLLGVRYNFALQLKSRIQDEKRGGGCYRPGCHDEAVLIKLQHASTSYYLTLYRVTASAAASNMNI